MGVVCGGNYLNSPNCSSRVASLVKQARGSSFFLPEPSATVPTPWSQNGGQNMISFSPNSRSSLQTLYNCFHMPSCAPDDEQTDLHMKYQWSASLKEKGGGGVKGGQTGKETRTGILLECPCAQLKGFKCYHSDDAGHVN